jgi:glycyl-tRNA synthetase (class II)
MKRKMFVVSAFEIHGGVAGLFDYGPSSCALKVNYCSVLLRSIHASTYAATAWPLMHVHDFLDEHTHRKG